MTYNLFWFRRDLRLDDNKALFECNRQNKPFIPLFILDDNILDNPDLSTRRVPFLNHCLKRLNEELVKRGSRLTLLKGTPLNVLMKLSETVGIEAIYFNRDYDPYAVKRDRAIKEYFRENGVKVLTYKDTAIHDRGEILKKDRTPYSVFTYYYKKWQPLKKPEVLELPETFNGTNQTFSALPTMAIEQLSDMRGDGSKTPGTPESFLETKIEDYKAKKDYPYLDATSRLSPLLRFGTVSVRSLYHDALKKREQTDKEEAVESIETFIRQLAWRDFYFQIIYYFPFVVESAFRKKYNKLAWENDPALFQSWCDGQTGFPLVDAGMRQLNKEGWMHNRLRMITASFLTKDLLIDWRWGAGYFQKQLLDHDLAQNNGGWQWAAGTGTDAQPYFRIFNPLTQSKKYDREGAFIREYVPELENVTKKYIHEPFKMPVENQRKSGCRIGKDYPFPVVDHAARRKVALAMYKRV